MDVCVNACVGECVCARARGRGGSSSGSGSGGGGGGGTRSGVEATSVNLDGCARALARLCLYIFRASRVAVQCRVPSLASQGVAGASRPDPCSLQLWATTTATQTTIAARVRGRGRASRGPAPGQT